METPKSSTHRLAMRADKPPPLIISPLLRRSSIVELVNDLQPWPIARDMKPCVLGGTRSGYGFRLFNFIARHTDHTRLPHDQRIVILAFPLVGDEFVFFVLPHQFLDVQGS